MIALLLSAGCLPQHAVARRDDLTAPRFHATLEVTSTEAPDLPAESWRVEGDVVVPWTRVFRDGTIGHAVVFEGTRSADGAPCYEGGVVEVRSFPNGEVVAVDGLGRWSGTSGHLELLDLLWPALSPRVPDDSTGHEVHGTAAWPVLFPVGPGLRIKGTGVWTGKAETVHWEATLAGESPYVRMDGTLRGDWTRERGAIRSAALDSTRTVTTRWAGGIQHLQRLATSVRLEHVDEVSPPALAEPFAPEDGGSDARAVVFVDGRGVSRDAVAGAQLPFLLVGPSTAERIRATLVEPVSRP